ncbi:MAG: type II toxin-antitoxin system VapC family toxin [Thaumarchaeota archaeon]|nr:type II toxin-antitoxin system VapC family toxin [Nitrososphaerota archaeon]
MNDLERIYIDTNVLIYWLFPSHPATAQPSAAFMQDVELSGKYYGIISDFTLNEMIKVIRNVPVAENKISVTSWKYEISFALKKIYALKNNNFTVITGSEDEVNFENNMNFGEISIEATQLMIDNPGTTKINAKGVAIHDGLHAADSLHAVLAKRMDCSRIATFDNDFDEISYYIPRMNVKEMYSI